MLIVYEILYAIYIILYLPFLVLTKRFYPGIGIRFGGLPAQTVQKLQKQSNIWIHAVSVGEVTLVTSLIPKLQARFPNDQIVLSTVTKTGYELALRQLSDAAVVVPAPLDFSLSVGRFVKAIQPRIYIAAETEIWPVLFRALSKRRIPIAIINGRISDKSLPRYEKIRFALKPILRLVSAFGMQSREDAERIVRLGAPEERVRVTGNLKFDGFSSDHPVSKGHLGIYPDELIWVAGSTHPGEEEIVFGIYRRLKEKYSNLRLIVAPRHVDRIPEVRSIAERMGTRTVLYSRLPGRAWSRGDVLLVDTIGHLKMLYGLSDIVFVGKSLTVGGGHNIIEPAVFGKPIIVGPSMENFRDITTLFLNNKALIQVRDAEELFVQCDRLILEAGTRAEYGQRAAGILLTNQGVTERTLALVQGLVR